MLLTLTASDFLQARAFIDAVQQGDGSGVASLFSDAAMSYQASCLLQGPQHHCSSWYWHAQVLGTQKVRCQGCVQCSADLGLPLMHCVENANFATVHHATVPSVH